MLGTKNDDTLFEKEKVGNVPPQVATAFIQPLLGAGFNDKLGQLQLRSSKYVWLLRRKATFKMT